MQAQQQLQQQLSEATTRLHEYTAADGLIDRAVTAAADAGELFSTLVVLVKHSGCVCGTVL